MAREETAAHDMSSAAAREEHAFERVQQFQLPEDLKKRGLFDWVETYNANEAMMLSCVCVKV